jgi:2-polyprenyl-3-methyl-5-hydroxy-6-metoxy-1,4-benzoquinol methylase
LQRYAKVISCGAMNFLITDPPRIFSVGKNGEIKLSDCGKLNLNYNEQVTFVTDSNTEYDVARKDWGYYATPSSARLSSFNLRTVLIRNFNTGRVFVLLVEKTKMPEFEKYLKDEDLEIITWLDDDFYLNGVHTNGWLKNNTWNHSQHIKDLYTKRCLKQVVEMTCHQQAAELLSKYVKSGDTVLDVGCGSGYFYHSLVNKNLTVKYWGIDATPSLIQIGKKHMLEFGLKPEQLQTVRIEDYDGQVDHVICINVLTNIDNYHRPLERILKSAKKSVILRESSKEGSEYLYVKDKYLDPEVDLKVHVNAYDTKEMVSFMESYGFNVTILEDRHSGGKPQNVIDYPHYWKFFVAERVK